MTVLTRHGEKRLRKRAGLKKKTAKKESAKALKEGITHAESRGRLRKFLDKLFLSHQKANNIRVYKGRVYLFHKDILITAISLPGNLKNIAEDIARKKRVQCT